MNECQPLIHFSIQKDPNARKDYCQQKGVSCYCPFKGKGKSEKQVKKEEVAKAKNDTTAAATAKIKENKKDKKEWSSPPQCFG
jgi:hypothetical protein